jgi:hypothetical protein
MSKKIMNFLEQAYNKEKYLSFLKEKFNFSELLEPIEITPNDVKSDVKSFKQLGSVDAIVRCPRPQKLQLHHQQYLLFEPPSYAKPLGFVRVWCWNDITPTIVISQSYV